MRQTNAPILRSLPEPTLTIVFTFVTLKTAIPFKAVGKETVGRIMSLQREFFMRARCQKQGDNGRE